MESIGLGCLKSLLGESNGKHGDEHHIFPHRSEAIMASSVEPQAAESEAVPSPPGRRRARSALAIGILMVAVAAGGYFYFRDASGREAADDAENQGPTHPNRARDGRKGSKRSGQKNQRDGARARPRR